MKNFRIAFSFLALLFCITYLSAQEVPYGINYQAVARDVNGAEMVSEQIDIRFSIVSGTPQGPTEYQEVHYGVNTSKYGVFTATIGTGTVLAGEKELLRDITWETDTYFLKVEIKFLSDFHEVGVMQFLSVPYALYAGRSLEPGPVGPQGPAGDPATDDQTLSFNGANLAISGGNTVNLAVLANDPDDEIQYLSIAGDSLSITNGNSIKLQEINIDDEDADPANELQTLSFSVSDSRLTISDGNIADLSTLENTDAQQLAYNSSNYQLSLDNSSSVTLGTLVAFRSTINTAISLPNNTNVSLVFDNVTYDEDNSYNNATGEFTVNQKGNYTLNISLSLPFGLCSVVVLVDDGEYEAVIGPTSGLGIFRASLTLRLLGGERVAIAVKQTNGFTIDPFNVSGSFSGFRVY